MEKNLVDWPIGYCEIEIYFRSTGFAFIGNIGGALALYLGISLVSVFELFEIILRLTCFRSGD